MSKRIIIAGSGFAGLWAALAAQRAIHLASQEQNVEVMMVSPSPNVGIRPRLYEAVLENMNPDISELLSVVGVKFLAGWVNKIDVNQQTIEVATTDGNKQNLSYDRFVLATGSTTFMPPIPGLKEYGFSVNTLEDAEKLDQHLKNLANKPANAARNTVVVAGGGLTGLETVTEMPERLRSILGETDVRVVLVDSSTDIGAAMGDQAATVIREALNELGVEGKAGLRVNALDATGVTLSNGEKIETETVIWTAGMRANPLTSQIAGEKDNLGRLIGDAYLHAPEAKNIFVTGDTVKVPTDDLGNFNVMSCQHAMSLGRVAGYNAAAELVDLPLHPYSQPKYVTCVDLGPWGALYTEGWDRQVQFVREEAKKIKQEINTVWIYPPVADREAVFAIANPDFVIVP
ncbi:MULTISPECIES: NAD(P)/FAD-dependent oxidoreductase [Acinetobacter calcoaceticus/baumannii complex]|uniref:NAD(P)/FAD-dependent oxidoreductase n=1 Tax=Acinetobacter calcoaceticus/baumannii complex TaxID=909768 RepID=UPI000278911D|nr:MULTISPECIES: FAD-dependent oxidoreductase [Acinetobacter calcoaceticus/baumannii complex]AVI32953.1 FAD dependent oxidoreductase family protein [Acinetobacter baumannii]AVI35559.1 FAD dependent oxidoreductase family protein [Acinetobacter baumannii]EHU1236095.1 FAD-dependent oxidoreductase [Acinetobacter baumannii]EHU1449835.1 FAD-dependent oxidoreductase [Acinetobacter baumannii]EHU1569305.1 FAD-dependent oxidoreductase [Acinetobacter baumannii]